MSKEFFLYVDSDYKLNASGAETASNFTYNLGNLLPFEFNKYYVELVYFLHPYNLDTNGEYLPILGQFYNVKINFKSAKISNNDSFIEIFTDQIPEYTQLPYVIGSTMSLYIHINHGCIVGRNGPKIVIDRPVSSIINIRITKDNTSQYIETVNNLLGVQEVPTYIKFLLKFTGIDENCNCK